MNTTASPRRAVRKTPEHRDSAVRVTLLSLKLMLACCATILVLDTPAQAQPAPVGQASIDNAPAIDRDRVDRANPRLPKATTLLPLPRAAVAIDRSLDVAPQAALKLTRVRFEGSSLPPETLAAAAIPYAGAPLTKETLQKLANAVSEVYAKSDVAFYAVSIPAQSAAGGILVIRVIEGRVVNYTIAKPTPSTPMRLIAAQLQPLLQDKPAHRSTIERTLSIIRDIPGQTVSAELRRTGNVDELNLDLGVKRKQVEVTLDVNNRGVVNVISGVQAQVGVALNGLLREGDSTRLSAYVPFQPSRYQFYSASHATPIGASGTTVAVSGAYVRTRTRDPEVRGEAKQMGIVLAHPLIRSYTRNLSLTASLDGTNSDNYYLDAAFGGFRTRAVRAGANWSSVGKTAGYGVSASLSQGLSGLGAQPTLGYSEERYRKANIQLIFVKQIGKGISVKAAVRAQYSGDRLPTAERFALGGEGAGLAFRYGILTADRAGAGSAELNWTMLGSGAAGSLGATAFVYADGVVARSLARPLYLLPARDYSLASAGGGLKVGPLKGWSATAQVAVPVETPGLGISRKARFFFSITRTA